MENQDRERLDALEKAVIDLRSAVEKIVTHFSTLQDMIIKLQACVQQMPDYDSEHMDRISEGEDRRDWEGPRVRGT